MRKKFEYRQCSCMRPYLQEFLKDRGQEGWELVSVAYDGEIVHLIFKREV